MIKLDFERLRAVCIETSSYAQTPEAPRINKAQFPSGCELGNQVCMLNDFTVRWTNHHAAGHSQMDDPLGARFRLYGAGTLARRLCLCDRSTSPLAPSGKRGRPPRTRTRRFQVEYDMLSYPPPSCDTLGLERGNNLRSCRFQRLGLRS